ncbi:unnamed protein product [Cunninghamella blakesleeana]
MYLLFSQGASFRRFQAIFILQEIRSYCLSGCAVFEMYHMQRKSKLPVYRHFIVLIGYDPVQDMFIYRDPTINNNYCVIPANVFDKARQSEGTDHDCLVIQLR